MPETIANISISYSSRQIKRDARGQEIQVKLDKVGEEFSKDAAHYTLKIFQGWLVPNGKYNVGYKGRAANALGVSQVPNGAKRSWAVVEKPTRSGDAIKYGRSGNPNKWWEKTRDTNPNKGRFKGGKVKRTNTYNYGPNTFLGRIQAWARARGYSMVTAKDGKKRNSRGLLRDVVFRMARKIATQGASGDYMTRGVPFQTIRGRGVFNYPKYFSGHLSHYHMQKVYERGTYNADVEKILHDAMIDHLDIWYSSINETSFKNRNFHTSGK